MFEIDVPFQKVIIFGIHNNFPGCSCWSMLMIVGLCHDFGSRVSSILLVVLMLWVRLVVSHVFLFVWENIYSSVFWGAEGDFSSWWGLMMGFSLQQMIWRWYHRFLQIGQDFTKRAADVHLSKRGAMEQLLYEAAAYTLGGDPELISSTTEKHEDGNTRLLLTSDVWHLQLYCILSGATWSRQALGKRQQDWLPNRPCWRLERAHATGGEILRLWDFKDFNAQHSNFNLEMSHLILAAYAEAQGLSGM